MPASLPCLVILADSPGALAKLGGISLVERLLRVVQRLGFREATICPDETGAIVNHLAKPSPPRAEVALKFRALEDGLTNNHERTLVLDAGYYYDRRLIAALAEKNFTTALIDSDPKSGQPIAETALLAADWSLGKNSREQLRVALSSAAELLDAARVPTYVKEQRRNIRPLFFPAPLPARAEAILRDTTQKGALDLPAYFHAPIENWIVARLCRTSITPNGITFLTACVGISVTILFAFGYLWLGTVLAVAVGILDGCDGKLARLKVETTQAGEWEHVADYLIELSWWSALAFHFHHTGEVPRAYLMWISLFVFDWLSRLGKGVVYRRTGRTLDDSSRFDRAVRKVSARRNIYIWTFAIALILGAAATGYIVMYWIGMISAAIHVVRVLQIRFGSPNESNSTRSLPEA